MTNTEVVEVLKKVVTHGCPMCEHEHFAVIGQTHVDMAGIPASSPFMIQVIVNVCEGCGFLMFHATRVLEKA